MYLYHITSADNLESVSENGLDPSFGGSNFNHGSYQERSKNYIFLTDVKGAKFWHIKIGDMSDYKYDDTSGHFPVLLKVNVDGLDIENDELGSKDSLYGAFMTKDHIEPERIRWWNGDQWMELEDWDVYTEQERGKLVKISREQDDSGEYVMTKYRLPKGYDYEGELTLRNKNELRGIAVRILESVKVSDTVHFDWSGGYTEFEDKKSYNRNPIDHLNPKDRQKAEFLYRKFKEHSRAAEEFYEKGEFVLAEEEDHKSEYFSEMLESFLEDVIAESLPEPDGEEYRFFGEDVYDVKQEISRAYYECFIAEYGPYDEDNFYPRMLGILRDYGLIKGISQDESKLTQEQKDDLLNLGKDIYLERKKKMDSYIKNKMNTILKEIIKYEIQNLLKENKRSELISQLRRDSIENENMMWFIEKYDHNLPNDETRAAVIEFGSDSDIFNYSYYIDKGPRDDTRNASLRDPYFSCEYAMVIDKKPRADTRAASWKDPYHGKEYDKYFKLKKARF